MTQRIYRKPQVYIRESAISASGKYYLFLGSHYEAGVFCTVVGVSTDREISMLHFNEKITDPETGKGCVEPKATAEMLWENFKDAMVRIPEDAEYEETYLEQVQITKYFN